MRCIKCKELEGKIKAQKTYSEKLERAVVAGARLYAGAQKGFGMTTDNALTAIMALADMVPEKKEGP